VKIRNNISALFVLCLTASCLAQHITSTSRPVATLQPGAFINRDRITASVRTLAAMSGCPNQASPNICDYGLGNPVVIASALGIATTPERGAVIDINTGSAANWIRFNSNLPWALRLGQHSSGAQWLGLGVAKAAADNNYIAATGNNGIVNPAAIEFSYNGQIRFLGTLNDPNNPIQDGAILTMQPSLVLSPSGQLLVGTVAPDANSVMEIASTSQRYIKLNGQLPWALRIGSLQSGAQFLSMGIAKTGADNTYIATTQNNTLVNHSSLQFGYDGSLQYLLAPHQSDGTQLNSLLAPSFAVSGTTDSTFGHMGIGASPSANRLEVGGSLHIASGGLIFPDGTQQTTASGTGATVSVGTTTTGPPGSRAQVTNSGTANAAILNFTIPQGPQGIQGLTGNQGPPGPPTHTSAICTQGPSNTASCSCAVRLIMGKFAPNVAAGSSCYVTSDTGSCGANGGSDFSGACCLCAVQ
jgi:hypothetical protein